MSPSAPASPSFTGLASRPTSGRSPDQLDLLRRGDVLTYCFRSSVQSVVSDGRVIDAAWRARERGVLFDIGHGMASFDFDVAEAALADDFPPDTISTDFYRRHLESVLGTIWPAPCRS